MVGSRAYRLNGLKNAILTSSFMAALDGKTIALTLDYKRAVIWHRCNSLASCYIACDSHCCIGRRPDKLLFPLDSVRIHCNCYN
ncbi:hypothetical protein AB833_20645 [Chromatiales bacterium (ex Bugula neritina AB1)]|nr:hypothetical protein AB833_20645 [Chromatiales bacterium (ex Bugula neritina AB1)]